MIWRLVVSPDVRASVGELKSSWTLDDLMAAHEVLDALDALRQEPTNGDP